MTKYNHTADDYKQAVEKAFSIAGVCRNLGIIAAGGNYASVKRHIEEYDIDTSHFTGAGWRKGQFIASSTSKSAIKSRLIIERGHQCQKCNRTKWFDEDITLELEHVDGNNSNNVEENLLLLCPNCHSLTPTWRRAKSSFEDNPRLICPACSGPKTAKAASCIKCKNPKKSELAKPTRPYTKKSYEPRFCTCGVEISAKANQCTDCAHNNQEKTDWPALEVLVTMLRSSSFVAVGKELKVSDNAVRNRLRNRGIDPKTLEKL